MMVRSFINQVIDYHGKLAELFVMRTKVSSLLHGRELRILCYCAVHVFELVSAYLATGSHNFGKW